MPSQPMNMKSTFGSIMRMRISGEAIRTEGLPPYEGSFAWMSPKLLETDSPPG